MLWHCFVVFHKNIYVFILFMSFDELLLGLILMKRLQLLIFILFLSPSWDLTSQLLSYGWKWHFLPKKHHTKLLQVHRNWGGGEAQPPRFGLNLTFYQLMAIIDKSKKEPKNINHISNSLKTTGSFTLFHVMLTT